MAEMANSYLWWLTVAVLLSALLYVLSMSVLYYWHGTLTLSRHYRNFPCKMLFPIISYFQFLNTAYSRKHPRAYFLQLVNSACKMFERERITMFWLGFRPMILLYKPENVERLLNNSVAITKSLEYDFLKPWLGTGLLTSVGKKWHYHRKLLTPAFHFQILENFLQVFNDEAAILTKKLEIEAGKTWVDIVPLISMCTLDTICHTAMGVQLNTQSGDGKEYVEDIEVISDAFIYRLTRPWLWFDFLFLYLSPCGWRYRQTVKRIHDFTQKVIKDKKCLMIEESAEKNDREETAKPKKKAFLELLLEHHLKDATFTEEDIREEVDTFMIEGHHTTAMSICWTLYELGRHPEVQEKVFEELDSIYGGDKEKAVSSDDLKRMKYLECTIKESLRLYPSVPFIGRQLTEDLTVNNYTLKPGSTCGVLISVLHMDPEQFSQPDIFDPDRFLPENNSKRHPYSYIPFSAGPRNCIGQRFALMEMKTILVHILRKFKVTSLDPRDKIEIMMGLVLKNAEPIRINFELRVEKDRSEGT